MALRTDRPIMGAIPLWSARYGGLDRPQKLFTGPKLLVFTKEDEVVPSACG